MKNYTAAGGFRSGAIVRVAVAPPYVSPGETVTAGPLQQHTRHSPDGHAWGYIGSGPSQLGLDILWDLFGREPHRDLYRPFTMVVIAALDGDVGFTLTEDEVRAWVDANGGFRSELPW